MQAKEELEKLIGIFGKENLLEAIFIFLGGFQNMISHNNPNPEYVDHRNFFNLCEFITKTKVQPLDRYFKLKLSLQGLCLIYEKAYKILNNRNNLNAQAVIDRIYAIIDRNKELTKIVNMVDGEGKKSTKLLNMIINPRGKPLFNNLDDFEKKILNNIRNLISEVKPNDHLDGVTNSKTSQSHRINVFLYKELVQIYCKIHNINVDKSIILAFILIQEEVQYLSDDIAYEVFTIFNTVSNNFANQLIALSKPIHLISILGEDYTFDSSEIDRVSDNAKVIYADNSFIPARISKDNLNYLISSDDEDVAKEFEDKVLADIEFDVERKSKSTNGKRFEDVPDVRPKTFEQKVCNLLPIKFNKKKLLFILQALFLLHYCSPQYCVIFFIINTISQHLQF